jgi:hypothetical protein
MHELIQYNRLDMTYKGLIYCTVIEPKYFEMFIHFDYGEKNMKNFFISPFLPMQTVP